MNNDFPTRKPTRLKGFDYNTAGLYFVTICVNHRKCLLGKIVGGDTCDAPQIHLSEYGKIAENNIKFYNSVKENVKAIKYVIMPNHIHMILQVTYPNAIGTSQASSPTHNKISRYVSDFKRRCNLSFKENIWQRSFHDHVIRDENDYLKIWDYVENNAFRWKEDIFYTN